MNRRTLFDSRSKYESGTGWPSFWESLPGTLGSRTDYKMLPPRTEYHCARCGGHQGHVFSDGPPPTGKRCCNNGAALKFIPSQRQAAGTADVKVPRLVNAVLVTFLAMASISAAAATATATAIFAGGCFWCTESDFEKLPGVIAAESGYTDGKVVNPNYEQVSAGSTGHTEGVRITYDSSKVSYAQLVDYFWKTIDPTVRDRQFCDIGNQYRTGIYWANEGERKIAESSRDALLKRGAVKEIHTQIAAASTFYPAEEYHQDYYKKNPVRYNYYRLSCGRDARLKSIWGGK